MTEKTHATRGASSAKRWLACPGSVRLSASVPPTTSVYAEEGTAAHALGELCLREGRDAVEFIDRRFGAFTVDEAMADAVQVYLDTVRGDIEPGDTLLIEQRVSLEALNPPVPMFGTSDATIIKPAHRRLIVADYKHGVGVPVEAKDNPQGRYYALGACLALGMQHPIDTVEIVIVQPRAPHSAGPVRRELLDFMDLVDWSAELLEGAARTEAADAPLNPGEWCQFCPATPLCPALRCRALEAAQIAFDDAPEIWAPPAPDTLTPDQLGRILQAADLIEEWLKAVRAHAKSELSAGRSVTGWKLVEGRKGNRKWVGDEPATAEALELLGLVPDEIFERLLRSPAQVEKLLPKEQRKLLSDLVSRADGSPTLARNTDSRPALLGAVDVFDAITEGTSE